MEVTLQAVTGYSVVLRQEQVSYLQESNKVSFPEDAAYPPNRQMLITFYQNANTDVTLKFQVAEAPLDLTGATVSAKFIETVPVSLVKITKSLSVVSPATDGAALLSVLPADVNFSGFGDLEVVVTKAGKTYKFLPRLEYRILPSAT